MAKDLLVPAERIERSILLIRGQTVLLDRDVAELYGVETKQLVRQVKRNRERFPVDFSFQLTQQEVADLKRQFGTSSSWGGRRTLPYAFTEWARDKGRRMSDRSNVRENLDCKCKKAVTDETQMNTERKLVALFIKASSV